MKQTYKIFILVLFFSNLSFGQESNVPKGFTKVKGLEYTGKITFYHNKKTNSILALQNKKVKWQYDIISFCGKPTLGKSEIREIGFGYKNNGQKLRVVYGQYSFADIEVETGKIYCSVDEIKPKVK